MGLKRTPWRPNRKPMKQRSEKREVEFRENGWPMNSTFAPKQRDGSDRTRQPDTGPKKPVVDLLVVRSGRVCEWPACFELAIHKHHRLNRKSGGRHGEMRATVNGVAWLLHACFVHHAYVTSPHGERLRVARDMGWLLMEHQDALRVPVLTRHDDEPVWLDAKGGWHLFEVGVA